MEKILAVIKNDWAQPPIQNGLKIDPIDPAFQLTIIRKTHRWQDCVSDYPLTPLRSTRRLVPRSTSAASFPFFWLFFFFAHGTYWDGPDQLPGGENNTTRKPKLT